MGIDVLLIRVNGQQKVHNIYFIQQHLLTVKMCNWIYLTVTFLLLFQAIFICSWSYFKYA